ncbi:hypothetical protein [Sphingomonas sp. BAUL-RG-20F-R05-02]|uniref:hypothetical protein n=1 Tax=Sphingomonas sp. BAUL-RG-20F-R05-02 TaxID=2914830 RepID=UPI001F5775E2|nr:hypothetical protein [Sphingomonas sp. BAUL-RG-20F-R05-02]
MSEQTDPAREFTDLCMRIRMSTTDSGENYLGTQFGVPPWSGDFVRILAAIHTRIDDLIKMMKEVGLDEDIADTAVNCLNTTRHAFTPAGTQNQWAHATSHYLTDANLLPIRMASAYLRPKYGYTVVSNEELEELVVDIEQLLEWLRERELSERDFIRSALIEGLEAFVLKLTKVGIYGWPETFASLREVVAAYLALDRGSPDAGVSPPYEAMVKKTGEVLQKIFDRVKFAKEVSETADWVLRGYGALTAAAQIAHPIVALLPHGA